MLTIDQTLRIVINSIAFAVCFYSIRLILKNRLIKKENPSQKEMLYTSMCYSLNYIAREIFVLSTKFLLEKYLSIKI